MMKGRATRDAMKAAKRCKIERERETERNQKTMEPSSSYEREHRTMFKYSCNFFGEIITVVTFQSPKLILFINIRQAETQLGICRSVFDGLGKYNQGCVHHSLLEKFGDELCEEILIDIFNFNVQDCTQPLVTKQKNRSHFYEYSPSKSSESSEMLEVVWTTESSGEEIKTDDLHVSRPNIPA
ncbi:hypothetical protein YC2023_083563 [Brassica napus]